MMSHRTGLPRHDQITFAARNRSAIMETLPYLPYDKQVRYQPGEYNNMMFAATGFLEEAVSGNSWEHEVQTRIFDRLNMSMSSPTMGLLRPDQRAKFARCYASSGGERDLDSTAVIDCLNADAAGPYGNFDIILDIWALYHPTPLYLVTVPIDADWCLRSDVMTDSRLQVWQCHQLGGRLCQVAGHAHAAGRPVWRLRHHV